SKPICSRTARGGLSGEALERGKEKAAGPTPYRFLRKLDLLSAVDGFFEVGAGSELRHSAGSNFDRGPGLRVPSIARFPLRNGKCPEPDQSNTVPFFQRAGNAIYGCVDCASGLSLANAAAGRDPVNKICFVHGSSWGRSLST